MAEANRITEEGKKAIICKTGIKKGRGVVL